ncbi:hypothetical protein, partial [uncultured Microscilla sp.]|uniref:hypothetical protein n=1 Tax=uncultured Microscilla sp. TaxID=432653 RepID=UPI0026243180
TAYDYSVLDARLATEPVNYQVKGQVTATKTAMLDAYGERTGWLTTVSYYDARGRVLQTIADNNKNGQDLTMTQYAFDGQVLQSVVKHQTTSPAATYYVNQWTKYDHVGRVLETYQDIADNYTYRDAATAEALANAQPATASVTKVSQLAYNELGQLITKKLGKKQATTEALQTLNFRYNIRGWMT